MEELQKLRSENLENLAQTRRQLEYAWTILYCLVCLVIGLLVGFFFGYTL